MSEPAVPDVTALAQTIRRGLYGPDGGYTGAEEVRAYRERALREWLSIADEVEKARAALAAADTPQPDRETTVAPPSGAG